MVGEAKEDYVYFLRIIEKKGESMSLEELLKLKHRVEAAEELSETEKRSLYDGRIGVLITGITERNYFERGRKEAEIIIERMFTEGKIDIELRTLLSDYLLVAAPSTRTIKGLYRSGQSYSRYVVPHLLEFIDYLHSRTGKTLGLSSLDIANVKQPTLTSFLNTVSKSASTQDGYRKILMRFRRWVHDNYPDKIHIFPPMEEIAEKKTVRQALEARHGKVLTEEEIKEVLYAVKHMKAPANEYYPIYVHLLLQCGLRPIHALMVRVEDVYGAEIAHDVFDRVFYEIVFEERVRIEKIKIEDRVRGKLPPTVLRLSPELKDSIEKYVVRNNLSDTDLLIPVKSNTIKNKFADIRKKGEIAGLTSTCFRDTWASVIYCSTGGITTEIVKELGGWRESKTVLDYYKNLELADGTTMTPSRAVGYLKEFYIYFPPAYKEHIELYIKKDVVPMSDVEQQEKLNEVYKLLEEQRKANEEQRKANEEQRKANEELSARLKRIEEERGGV